MQPLVLLADFGSTYTKLTLVDLEKEIILSSALAPTTIETDIMEGFQNAFFQLSDSIKLESLQHTFAASSAGGGLRIIASGLVPELTATAAKMTALNAGGKIIKVFSFELTEEDCEEISQSLPDILLLTGGTDGGNKRMIMENVHKVAGIKGDFTVVLACNRTVVQDARKIIEASGKKVVVTENVMPKLEMLNISPARTAIRDLFLEDIIQSKGLSNVESLIEGILMPTPSAVMAAVELLSKGYEDEEGLDNTLTIDVGGATTDVYSATEGLPTNAKVILKGFREPYLKRTVEGDLGMRHNADHIVDEAGISEMAKLSNMNGDQLASILDQIKQNPSMVPTSQAEELFDIALSKQAIRIAVERHAGHHEIIYTIEGATVVQIGKDLSEVNYIIGTGGPLVHAKNPKMLLGEAIYSASNPTSLRPKKPKFLLDCNYVLSAMGLLATHYPKTALRIMKKSLLEI